jgi:hypothetical protein
VAHLAEPARGQEGLCNRQICTNTAQQSTGFRLISLIILLSPSPPVLPRRTSPATPPPRSTWQSSLACSTKS